MSNSSMVDYVKISPYKHVDRIDENGVQHSIKKITWHHVGGVTTVEALGEIMTRPGRNMSATYGIGSDARVGRYLDEKDRPWTSSSRSNDFQAITIEISNSKTGGDWPISDKVMQKAIDLTVDICKRNGIKKLTYTGDATGNFTFHKMFAATACPGPYIESRANEIVNKINAKLNPTTDNSKEVQPVTTTFKKGDLVKLSSDARYYSGASVPTWVKNDQWYLASVDGDRAVLGKSKDKSQNIQSPINTKYLILVKTTTTTKSSIVNVKDYTVALKSTSVIYTDPTKKDAKTTTVGKSGTYTITHEQTVNGKKYGKLKSGAGWVIVPVKSTKETSTTFKKGDKVKVLKAEQYNGKSFKVYSDVYYILEVSGDRAVISSDNKNVTCAINTKNIKKI